jgi:hypothetical protein
MTDHDWRPCCVCGDDYPAERAQLGYRYCLPCGDDIAREERKSWTVAPMHKSNYMLFTNPADLIGINNKGGLVK